MKFSLVFIFFILTAQVYACSCDGPGTIEESFHSADVVIRGTVIKKTMITFRETMDITKGDSLDSVRKINPTNQKLNLLNAQNVWEIQLAVTRNFKGANINDTISIYTTRSGASCGYTQFKEGEEFIVYGYTNSYAFWMFDQQKSLEKKGTFWTNMCTRTTLYHHGEEHVLEQLSTSQEN